MFIEYNPNPKRKSVGDCVIRALTKNVEVWKNCCETVTVRNISDQPIQVQNANIPFSRPDLQITY